MVHDDSCGGSHLDLGPLLAAPEVTEDQRNELRRHVARGWVNSAACRGVENDYWFPDIEEPTRRAAAVRHCTQCPVKRSCLAFALATSERFGIWGGTTEIQRDAIRIDLARGVDVRGVLDSATVRPAFLWKDSA